jgi:hypothetical protein
MYDLFAVFWLNAGLAAIFVWLPGKIFPEARKAAPGIAVFVGIARMTAITAAGVVALATLRVFNAFTILLFYVSLILLARLRRNRWSLDAAFGVPARRITLLAADLWEFSSLRRLAREALWNKMRSGAAHWMRRVEPSEISLRTVLFRLAQTVAIGLTFVLRFTQPLSEIRLGQVDSYQVLLAARQLLTQQLPARSPILPSVVAAVSLITSTDPMQVVRFIDPALGCLLVFATGAAVRRLTKHRIAALAAMYALGVYVFALPLLTSIGKGRLGAFAQTSQEMVTRQWSASEVGLGTLLLLIAFLYLVDRPAESTRWMWLDVMCCVTVAILTFFPLLSLVPLFALALWVGPRVALATLAAGWVLLALGAALTEGAFPFHRVLLLTLPVGLALMAGLLALSVFWLFRLLHREYAETITGSLLVLLAITVPAASVASEYVEYDTAARQALRIGHDFPRQQWVIAAPAEQLAEVYGIGGHLDLAEFVDEYQARADSSGFDFSLPADNLFVFVEKRPFRSSSTAAGGVSFAALVDPTYRNYRSPAGRASLEFATLNLCEAYRRSHPDSSVYYEDEVLRIYRFHARRTS